MEKPQASKPSFEALLRQAIEEPGIISKAYSAFYSYSLGNQLAAYSQCLARSMPVGPIATLKAWNGKGRRVKSGEKALCLCMPVTMKKEQESQSQPGETETVHFNRFIWRNNWFTIHQTEGKEQEPITIPGWDKALALTALGIVEEPFASTDGNCQGYAKAGVIAINPVAVLPLKTTFHEIAHNVLGHVKALSLTDSDTTPRDIGEIEAECVAFLITATLGLPGMPESRGYIQSWAKGSSINEKTAQRIMSAASKILKAGALESEGK